MADKHALPLAILREYRVDLSVPHKAEFDIVSCTPIDAQAVAEFATQHGLRYQVGQPSVGLYMATLTKQLILTERDVRPLSEAVESFCARHGWDYSGWGASSWK